MKKFKAIALTICSCLFALCTSVLIGVNLGSPVSARADETTGNATAVTTWQMRDGASVRVQDPTALRFTAMVSKEDYETYLMEDEETGKTAAGETVTFGMFILPYEYLTDEDGETVTLNEETLFGEDCLFYWGEADSDKEAAGLKRILHYTVDDLKTIEYGYYLLNCAMSHVKVENYTREFYAKAYYAVKDSSGTTTRYYTDDNETNVRTVSYVSQKALDDTADSNNLRFYSKYSNYATTLVKYGMTLNTTIQASTGKVLSGDAYSNRITCTHLLNIKDVQSITINNGYEFTWIAYDENGEYVGNGKDNASGNWLTTESESEPYEFIVNSIYSCTNVDYSGAVYFRFAIRLAGNTDMTAEDIENCGLEVEINSGAMQSVTAVGGTIAQASDAGAVDGNWTVNEDGSVTTEANSSAREVKYFSQTGLAYTAEATVTIPKAEKGWMWAGILFRTADKDTQYAFMAYYENNNDKYGILLLDVDAWTVLAWIGTPGYLKNPDTENGDTGNMITLKVVNDGMHVTLYHKNPNAEDSVYTEVVTLQEKMQQEVDYGTPGAMTVDDFYASIAGKENAIGLISLTTASQQVTFSDCSLKINASRTVSGSLTVSDKLGLPYDLADTVVSVTTGDNTVEIKDAVNADGSFAFTIPVQAGKITFTHPAFLPITYDLAAGTTSITDLSLIFDCVAVHTEVALGNSTVRGTDGEWTTGEKSVTSGGNEIQIKYFEQTGSAYIVETTITGLTNEWEPTSEDGPWTWAGITFRSADDNAQYAFVMFLKNKNYNTYELALINASTGSVVDGCWYGNGNGAFDSSALAGGKAFTLKVLCNAAQIELYINDTLVATLLKDNFSGLIGQENAIGLISIDDSVTFSNFTIKTNELHGESALYLSDKHTIQQGYGGIAGNSSKLDRVVSQTYLLIDQIRSVSLDSGYNIMWYAYDVNGNYIGNGATPDTTTGRCGANWLGVGAENGISFDPAVAIRNTDYNFTDNDGVLHDYSKAVYFRFSIRNEKDSTTNTTITTMDAVSALTVTPKTGYTYSGESILIEKTITEKALISNVETPSTVITEGTKLTDNNYVSYMKVDGFTIPTIPNGDGTYQYTQDGAVYGDYLFSLTGAGYCRVYSLTTNETVGTFQLTTNNSTLVPHCNAVCFGAEVADGYDFPLLYANVYNGTDSDGNYMPGVCNVYGIKKVTDTDGTITSFESTLVQVIKIGFTTDEIWLGALTDEDGNALGSYRPFGNFVVDTANNKLYSYVMIDNGTLDTGICTRFFEFALPKLTDGVIGEDGVSVVTLTKPVEGGDARATDYISYFDTEYMQMIQGACYYDGKIYSLNGPTGGDAFLRVIDLEKKQVVTTICLTDIGLIGSDQEAEAVYVYEGTLYIVSLYKGEVYAMMFY